MFEGLGMPRGTPVHLLPRECYPCHDTTCNPCLDTPHPCGRPVGVQDGCPTVKGSPRKMEPSPVAPYTHQDYTPPPFTKESWRG